MLDFEKKPLSELLMNRTVFAVFEEEFSQGTWLDVTALLASDSNIHDLYQDLTVPKAVLDRIVERLRSMEIA